MYTTGERSTLREHLLKRAQNDTRISGSAITGSAATTGLEDQWSDIDLAFGVATSAGIAEVLADWTAHMYREHRAVHHMDIRAGNWIYRVFFLENTLQVDLAFVPAEDFRPLAPTFRLIHGTAREPLNFPPPQPVDLIGFGWLYAIHARTSIARKKVWQAEYMISSLRDQALALACLRHNLPAAHGKGNDQLPAAVRAQFEPAIVASLNADELARAFAAAIKVFLQELHHTDPALARKLEQPLNQLAG
jgi:hypothetical protein